MASLAVTLGDPRGIGPEVALEAVRAFEHAGSVTLVGPDPFADRVPDGVGFEGIGTFDDSDEGAGRAAASAIDHAVGSALDGIFQGIVTAPLHKPSLHAAGRRYPGQTEMLADLAGSAEVGMLMAAERTRFDAPLRVLLATTHHALRDVPELVTRELLSSRIALLGTALRADWGLPEPRIALCALNPHASDGGLFGTEEAEIMEPALEDARAEGWAVDGPVPADTVFQRALSGEFDAVVAPYHDVGMAAFKSVAFGAGVNVTVGLPFVRTSPDHGTAFDIAGRGVADASSMKEAIRLATELADRRFDTGQTL